MDNHLHLSKQIDECPHEETREDSLLNMLTDTIRGLEAVTFSTDHYNGTVGGRRCIGEETETGIEEGMHSPAETESEGMGRRKSADEEQQEKDCKKKSLAVLREVSVFHSNRVTAWREALRDCACILNKYPPGGANQHHQTTTDNAESKDMLCSDSFSNTFWSIGEDVENILDKLNIVITKLDAEILKICAEETLDVAPQESKDSEGGRNDLSSHECSSGQEQEIEDGGDQSLTRLSPDTDLTSALNFESLACNDGANSGHGQEIEGQDNVNILVETHTDFLEKTNRDTKRIDDKSKEETNNEWITVGLSGHLEDDQSDVQDACFIRAPMSVAEVLRCDVADNLSCLMVTGSEELVSRVVRVKVQDGASVHFPITVVVPFCTRYRGSYRDVAVKVVDGARRASYITPVTTEGTYGGQRGSFAEVKVYFLGLFAVISCLKRESYTVPSRGLSHKLPMDPRICLNYLPGSFTTSVMVQSMIQPVDAVLLAAVKSRSDAYQSVVSTSPLLYLTHPSSQPLKRPLTLTLPCPPNPEKKRDTRGQRKETEHHHTWPVSAAALWDPSSSCRVRMLGSSVQSSKEMSTELLIILGSSDKQWSVLEKVTIRNQQNGLVSFELTEMFDRLLVVRLLSPLQPCHLTSLAEELEESVCCHAVTVVLWRRQDEPHTVMVAALPSRDLSWEMSKLQAQGYSDPLETSSEICMREGDQLLVHFSGNITATVTQTSQPVLSQRITFHSQWKNHLFLHLTEVDPFGNYSSPHYKGTAMFYKITRGQLEWRGDVAVPMDAKLLGDPVCKLSLTLPKKVRSINRPIVARVKLCEETDSLSDSLLLWLSGKLSEEEIALLVLSLRLRRSATQLVRLRAGDSLSAQAFQVLAMWRRGLPAASHQPKASQLAHCLAKSGRPDLARELLLRQAATTTQGLLK
ncbi:death domain-containing protein 1 [Scomber scombrus]|uniref:death domain-containing protein 1 n=1 Tax=Scomber scombrus TaxID=13677 RepID=UPI002DDC246D|nr:death domain-containing protein 1 [Scomber scombrus]